MNRGKRCTTATKAHVFTSSKKSVLCLRLYVKEKYSWQHRHTNVKNGAVVYFIYDVWSLGALEMIVINPVYQINRVLFWSKCVKKEGCVSRISFSWLLKEASKPNCKITDSSGSAKGARKFSHKTHKAEYAVGLCLSFHYKIFRQLTGVENKVAREQCYE